MESNSKPCPYCEHTIQVPPVRENTIYQCPHCGKKMDVYFDFEQTAEGKEIPVWDIKKLAE